MFQMLYFILTYHTAQLLVETKTELPSGRGHLNNEPRKPKGKQTFMRTVCDKTNSVNFDPSFYLLVRFRKVFFKRPPLRTNISERHFLPHRSSWVIYLFFMFLKRCYKTA